MAKSVVYNSDCLEAMRAMPDKAFDLAIVDPPYGIGDFSMTTNYANRPALKAVKAGSYDWNNERPTDTYFRELRRVSERQIIWGANYYNCFNTQGGAIVWFKNMGHSDLSQCEIASRSWGKKVDYLHLDWQGGFSRKHSGGDFHPCQKPVALYKWLLQNYAKPGDTILDTHLGSGSSRIAAYDLGFDFTGYELDKDYFEAQEQRFADHIAQPKLWEPASVPVIQGDLLAA